MGHPQRPFTPTLLPDTLPKRDPTGLRIPAPATSILLPTFKAMVTTDPADTPTLTSPGMGPTGPE
jgi:hypothetical protein